MLKNFSMSRHLNVQKGKCNSIHKKGRARLHKRMWRNGESAQKMLDTLHYCLIRNTTLHAPLKKILSFQYLCGPNPITTQCTLQVPLKKSFQPLRSYKGLVVVPAAPSLLNSNKATDVKRCLCAYCLAANWHKLYNSNWQTGIRTGQHNGKHSNFARCTHAIGLLTRAQPVATGCQATSQPWFSTSSNRQLTRDLIDHSIHAAHAQHFTLFLTRRPEKL